MHPLTRPILTAALLLPLGGCIVVAAAAAGAAVFGTISYRDNEATLDFRADLTTVWQACLASMQELGYSVSMQQQPGVTEGVIEADPAKVKVERHPGNFTRVIIRVGTFASDDNKRRATLLLEAVKKRVNE